MSQTKDKPKLKLPLLVVSLMAQGAGWMMYLNGMLEASIALFAYALATGVVSYLLGTDLLKGFMQ
jgi:hypothetical protein